MKCSYIFLSDNFEQIEALTVVDCLRRAEVPIRTISMNCTLEVVSSHGVTVVADELFQRDMFADADYLILPGGSTRLNVYDELKSLLIDHAAAGGRVAAICAAPMVLGGVGLLRGKRATCYPGFESYLDGAIIESEAVVVDGSTVTANGAASALKFSYALLEQICGSERTETIREQMMFE